MKLKAFVVGMILAVPMVSHAEFVTGNDIVGWLQSAERVRLGKPTDKDAWDAFKVQGYVMGVYDAYKGIAICPPDNIKITVRQVEAIVKKYITDRPENWGGDGASLVGASLMEVWPCQQTKPQTRSRDKL